MYEYSYPSGRYKSRKLGLGLIYIMNMSPFIPIRTGDLNIENLNLTNDFQGPYIKF